jgi:hypothetical protein
MKPRDLLWTAAMLLACSGDKGGPSGGAASGRAYALCDGSADIRLAFALEGGAVDTTYQLTNPYGHSFLFVDGRCHYYASGSWMKGVVQGDLSKARAAQLAQALDLKRIETLDYHDVDGCPDAGVVWLRTHSGYTDCTCGCDATAPKGTEDAIDAAGMLKDELADSGAPLASTILLAAILEERSSGGRAVQAWPLIWPLSDLAVNWETYTRKPDSSLRHLVGEEAEAARALRAEPLRADPYARGMQVSDQGKTYSLFMREELPDEAADAIARLLGR